MARTPSPTIDLKNFKPAECEDRQTLKSVLNDLRNVDKQIETLVKKTADVKELAKLAPALEQAIYARLVEITK